MGRRIIIHGEPHEYEEDTRLDELKREAGFPDDDIIVFDEGEGLTPVTGDTVGTIPEDSTVSHQPAKGRLFG